MKKMILFISVVCSFIIISTGCKKFLDERPKNSLRIPTTLADLQALMDNYSIINYQDMASSEMVAGDFYLTDADWKSRPEVERRLYLWEKDNVFTTSANDWITAYSIIYRANTVIEGMNKINKTDSNSEIWNNTAGQGYYTRAKYLLQLIYCFALAYDEEADAPGIPLRLSTDFNETSVRSGVNKSYMQIVDDLKKAIMFLPVTQIHVMRPSKPAAYGLLARTYLSMRKYELAGLYADSCLQLKADLLDYNDLDLKLTNPFITYHKETLAYSYFFNPGSLSNIRAKINPDIINSYAAGDLRKTVFYKDNGNGSFAQRGSYSGVTNPFGGIATDEIYLIRAECYARAGKVSEAMKDLNTLMLKRWDKKLVYPIYVAATKEEAVNLILKERRKELVLRGLRWMDIKRLNKEGRNISLNRTINGETYRLEANSTRFANPIPDNIITVSGMEQNKY